MTVGHNASDRPAKTCNERGTVSPASQALALRRRATCSQTRVASATVKTAILARNDGR